MTTKKENIILFIMGLIMVGMFIVSMLHSSSVDAAWAPSNRTEISVMQP